MRLLVAPAQPLATVGSDHRVRLARTGLAVREETRVGATKHGAYQGGRRGGEDLLVGVLGAEHRVVL